MTDEPEDGEQQYTQHPLETRTAMIAAVIVALICFGGAVFTVVAALVGALRLVGVDQIGIVVTGVVAVFLTQSKHESRRRWACVFGTLGQPFWIYAAISAHQTGVLFVSVLYTAAWLRGVSVHWLQPRIKKRRPQFTVYEESRPFGTTLHGICGNCFGSCHALTPTSRGYCCAECIRKLSTGVT